MFDHQRRGCGRFRCGNSEVSAVISEVSQELAHTIKQLCIVGAHVEVMLAVDLDSFWNF